MTDIIAHLRKLMSIADEAGSPNDGKIDTLKGRQYIEVLIARADALGCVQEKKLLEEIDAVFNHVQKSEFDAAESRFAVPEILIRAGLISELKKTPEGNAVLNWKEQLPSCSGMDYSLPTSLQYNTTVTHKKREH